MADPLPPLPPLSPLFSGHFCPPVYRHHLISQDPKQRCEHHAHAIDEFVGSSRDRVSDLFKRILGRDLDADEDFCLTVTVGSTKYPTFFVVRKNENAQQETPFSIFWVHSALAERSFSNRYYLSPNRLDCRINVSGTKRIKELAHDVLARAFQDTVLNNPGGLSSASGHQTMSTIGVGPIHCLILEYTDILDRWLYAMALTVETFLPPGANSQFSTALDNQPRIICDAAFSPPRIDRVGKAPFYVFREAPYIEGRHTNTELLKCRFFTKVQSPRDAENHSSFPNWSKLDGLLGMNATDLASSSSVEQPKTESAKMELQPSPAQFSSASTVPPIPAEEGLWCCWGLVSACLAWIKQVFESLKNAFGI